MAAHLYGQTAGPECPWRSSLRVVMYLPAWLGNVLEIGEVVLDPSIDVFQGHALPLGAIDGELYHGHVRIWWPLRHRVLPGC